MSVVWSVVWFVVGCPLVGQWLYWKPNEPNEPNLFKNRNQTNYFAFARKLSE